MYKNDTREQQLRKGNFICALCTNLQRFCELDICPYTKSYKIDSICHIALSTVLNTNSMLGPPVVWFVTNRYPLGLSRSAQSGLVTSSVTQLYHVQQSVASQQHMWAREGSWLYVSTSFSTTRLLLSVSCFIWRASSVSWLQCYFTSWLRCFGVFLDFGVPWRFFEDQSQNSTTRFSQDSCVVFNGEVFPRQLRLACFWLRCDWIPWRRGGEIFNHMWRRSCFAARVRVFSKAVFSKQTFAWCTATKNVKTQSSFAL